jgi:isopenicillin-N epimerase
MQFVSIPLPDATNLAVLKMHLYDEYHIEVPLILWNGRKFIRVSVQGYNTRREVEMLIDALKVLLGFKN